MAWGVKVGGVGEQGQRLSPCALCRGRIAVRRGPQAGPVRVPRAPPRARGPGAPPLSPPRAAAVLPPASALRRPLRAQPAWASGSGVLRAPASPRAQLRCAPSLRLAALVSAFPFIPGVPDVPSPPTEVAGSPRSPSPRSFLWGFGWSFSARRHRRVGVVQSAVRSLRQPEADKGRSRSPSSPPPPS